MTSEEFLKVKLGENNFTVTTGIKVRVVERLLTEFAQIHVNAAEKAKRMYSEEDMMKLAEWLYTDCFANTPFGYSYKDKYYTPKELLELWKKKQFNMEKEYVIIDKTALQKRIEELGKRSQLGLTDEEWNNERGQEESLKQILSQSTPLIPENINKILSTSLGSEEK